MFAWQDIQLILQYLSGDFDERVSSDHQLYRNQLQTVHFSETLNNQEFQQQRQLGTTCPFEYATFSSQ